MLMDNYSQTSSACVYEICFRGQLDERRARWFEGMTMERLPSGETRLTGPLPDQPALYGILNRIRDLGLELLSVRRL
jgi:hypothetical protein